MRRHLIKGLIINSCLMAVFIPFWYLDYISWIWIISPIWIPIARDLQAKIHKQFNRPKDVGPGYKD